MLDQPLNRHQKNRARTRKQLEQAVFTLLLKKGYDAITIQDIVDQADLGRGTFYLHFRDKEEAVWSFIENGLRETDLLAHEKVNQDPSAATFKTALNNVFKHVEKNRDLFKVMLGSQGSAAVTLKVQDWLAQDIEKEVRANYAPLPVPLVPLTISAQILTGAITRLAIWWLETPNPYSAEEIAELGYKAIKHGIDWE